MKNPEEQFYLTKRGLDKLKEEFAKLKELRKSKIGKTETPIFLVSEDLNAEFVSFKEELDLIDGRLAELSHILKNYRIISQPPPAERTKATLGAIIDLEIDGQNNQFQLVGTLEANPSLGMISNESPIGLALIGKTAGQEVIIGQNPPVVYKIKNVSYLK